VDPNDLLAIREVEQLKYRYVRGLDTKDWDLFRSTLADDVVATYGARLSFAGPDEIVAYMAENLGPTMITLHQVHHPEITVDGDSATGRWSLQDRVIMTEFRILLEGASIYEDRYVRGADGEWRIARTGYERLYEHTVSLDDVPSFKLLANRFAACPAPPHAGSGARSRGPSRPPPEVVERVAPPRSPGLGGRRGARRVAGPAYRGQAPAGGEVAGEEDVGIAQRSEAHVVGCPRSDPREVEERGAGVRPVGGGGQVEVAGVDRAGRGHEGAGPGPGHGQLDRVTVGERHRGGKGVREAAGDGRQARRQGLAGLVGQAAEDRPRTGDRHLLADDRPHQRLGAVHRPRPSEPGRGPHERAEERVGTQRCIDDGTVGVQVEQPSQRRAGRGGIARRRQPDLGDHAPSGHRRIDERGPLPEAQDPTVPPAVDRLDAVDGPVGEERQERFGGEGPDGRQAVPDHGRLVGRGGRATGHRPSVARSPEVRVERPTLAR